MTLATVLVLFIIAVELYRPIIIGNAIDQYINGYYHPYVEADVSASDAVNWNGLVLSRDQAVSKADSDPLKSSRRNRIPAFKIPLKSFCLKTFRSLEVSFCAPSLT